MSQSRARIRKLPVHDYMTHVVKIDILTGHKEKGSLHFILKKNLIAHLSENHAFFFLNFNNLFRKYSILPNEILLKYLFLKL